MNSSKVISKVKKLLRLANGTDFEDEAFVAMLKAQEMLLDTGLTMAEIGDIDDDEPVKRVDRKEVDDGCRSLRRWKIQVSKPICDNFRVTLLIQPYPGWNGKKGCNRLLLLGLEQDVEVCKEVLLFAFGAFNRCFKRFLNGWKAERGVAKVERRVSEALRNDYLHGFVGGLRQKFQEQVEAKALVLTQDAMVKRELDKMNLGKELRFRYTRMHDPDAYRNGFEDGKRLDHSDIRSRGGEQRSITGQ